MPKFSFNPSEPFVRLTLSEPTYTSVKVTADLDCPVETDDGDPDTDPECSP